MRTIKDPLQLFAALLLILFSAESGIMWMLTLVTPGLGIVQNLVDASLLAALSAPFIWWLIISPMRKGSLKEIDRCRDILGRIVDAVVSYDTMGRIGYLNPAAQAMFGYLPDELLGSDIGILLPCEGGRMPMSHSRLERVLYRKDGTSFPVEVSLSVLDQEGEATFIAIIHDISEPLKAKQEWEMTFDAIVDPLMILDTNHQVVKANRSMSAKLAALGCHVGGRDCSVCAFTSDQVPLFCPHSQVMKDQRPHAAEIYAPRLGGHFMIVAWPLFGRDGELKGSVYHARDITERKDLEQQLQHAQKVEAVTTLAGGVAHDFNNILMGIVGYASLAELQLQGLEPAHSHVKNILTAADRASGVVRSLLDFCREGGSALEPVDLNKVVGRVEQLLKPLLPDVEVRMNLCAETLMVSAAAGQIEQVLTHLCKNSHDAMGATGVITVGTDAVVLDHQFVSQHGGARAGKYAVLACADTGKGMTQEIQQRIFDPFFTTKEVGKGCGLGLSIVYGIARQHNGFITCESAPEHGAVFRMYLPLCDQG